MPKFKIGEGVVLNGSCEEGPIMTVAGEASDKDPDVLCFWFDKEQHLQSEQFPESILSIVVGYEMKDEPEQLKS